MEKIKEYKWVLLAGVLTAVLIGLITANFNGLQFLKYKMNNDTTGIIKILQTGGPGSKNQNQWYFKQGMTYLINRDEYSEEIQNFFKENFNAFNEENKLKIIEGYNSQKLFIPMDKEFMTFLLQDRKNETIQAYIKRIEPESFEEGLVMLYGNKPEVNEQFITQLNDILTEYPKKLPFQKFTFSLYKLLNLNVDDQQKKAVLQRLNMETAKPVLFNEMKTKPITEQQLSRWVKLFKDTSIITINEYTRFDSIYSEICILRKQYQGLDDEAIELKNRKEAVDAKISENKKQLESTQNEISKAQAEIDEIERKLDSLTSYAYMPLYIERASGTGSGEYIASIPRGGLFGSLKPSSQKYIVKLVDSSALKEGVVNLNVYLEGSKTTSDGAQYAYYVEVSNSDMANIEAMTTQRDDKITSLNAVKQKASELENAIETVKRDNDYEEVVKALGNIDNRRSEYKSKAEEKVTQIKEMFGLGNVVISFEEGDDQQQSQSNVKSQDQKQEEKDTKQAEN